MLEVHAIAGFPKVKCLSIYPSFLTLTLKNWPADLITEENIFCTYRSIYLCIYILYKPGVIGSLAKYLSFSSYVYICKMSWIKISLMRDSNFTVYMDDKSKDLIKTRIKVLHL